MVNELNADGQPAGRRSFWAALRSSCGTQSDRRNQYWFVAWTLAWALSFVAANWVIKKPPATEGLTLWLVAIAPNIFAIGAVLAYMRFLRAADELMRKIQIDGLAVGFGAALIFNTGYTLLETAGAPRTDTITVMCVAWVAGQMIGVWRYR
jgi:hypothetical protein